MAVSSSHSEAWRKVRLIHQLIWMQDLLFWEFPIQFPLQKIHWNRRGSVAAVLSQGKARRH
jgi:hypothetical protein